MKQDCELTLTTNELELFLEEGDGSIDLWTALEAMLKIANSKGKAICIFTLHKSEVAE